MKKVSVNIWTKDGFIERQGYRFKQEMHCGGFSELIVSKGNQGYWAVHEFNTGLYVHGASKKRSDMVDGMKDIIKIRKMTKKDVDNAISENKLMNV